MLAHAELRAINISRYHLSCSVICCLLEARELIVSGQVWQLVGPFVAIVRALEPDIVDKSHVCPRPSFARQAVPAPVGEFHG